MDVLLLIVFGCSLCEFSGVTASNLLVSVGDMLLLVLLL